MTWLEKLKTLGLENDQAHLRILEFFSETTPGRRVNSTELSLMGFRRWKKMAREWVRFSPSCIERKARKLAELGILERGYDTSHHAWFAFNGESPAKTPKYRIEIPDGPGPARMYVDV